MLSHHVLRTSVRVLRVGAALGLALTVITCGGDAPGPTGVDASAIAFVAQPGDAAAGASLGAIRIEARSPSGGVVTGFTGDVTIAISGGSGAPGATLSGATTVAAVNGVATFSNLSVDKVGTGYTLTASTPGLSAVASTAFAISPGALSELAFTVQPSDVASGAAIVPAVQVTGRDAFGNTVTGFTGPVTVALATNPTGGAQSAMGAGTLNGTTTVPAVAGVATFNNISIDNPGSGYQLQATAGTVISPLSVQFAVGSSPATQLAFIRSPAVAEAGMNFTPSVQVVARDALGNDATGFAGNVTVALGNAPPGAVLEGIKTLAAINGVATFPGLDIDRLGTGYTLKASSAGLPDTISPAFDVVQPAVAALAFTSQPGNVTAGAAFSTLKVTARSASGQTVTSFTDTVTLAIAENPAGGTLSGTTKAKAVNGVATFSGLNIDKSGVRYRLGATAGGLSATSVTFDVLVGTPTQLVFTVQPSNARVGVTIAPQVEVTAQDALGNRAEDFTGYVTVAFGANPGSGSLNGTTTVAAVSGAAAFSTLSVTAAGTGYTLVATASGLSPATSATFDITASVPNRLVFWVPPSDAVAGAAIAPAVEVMAQDSAGNPLTGFSGPVTVSITAGSGRDGAQGTPLFGTTTVSAVNGVATFSDLSITMRSTGYRLSATASGFAGATSPQFAISTGPAATLNFAVHPDPSIPIGAGATLTPVIEVDARDAYGNRVLDFASPVTMAIAVNPGGGTLSGTTTVTPFAGTAKFSDLSIDKSGQDYRLVASTSGIAADTTPAVDIIAQAATRLIFTVQPSSVTRGTAIFPAVKVAALDELGNVATGFTGTITIAIANNAGGGALYGTTTAAAVNGVATFSGLIIDKAAPRYTLAATATGLAGATSVPFDILAGTTNQLIFAVQPSNAVAGAAIAPAIQVNVLDPQGALTTAVTNVTLSIETNPGSGALGGTTSVAVVNGVATFSNVTIDRAGVGYRLRAAPVGPAYSATSQPFDITAAAALRQR